LNEVKNICKEGGMTDKLAIELQKDKDFLRMLSYGTNGWKNLTYSFSKVNGLWNKNYGEASQ